MNPFFKSSLLLALFGLLAACGQADEHGHAHDGDADHAHEAAADDHGHAHDGEDHGHAHDDHAHEAPQTEAFYGDQADEPAEVLEAAQDEEDEEHEHTHDGKPHAHKH